MCNKGKVLINEIQEEQIPETYRGETQGDIAGKDRAATQMTMDQTQRTRNKTSDEGEQRPHTQTH